MRVAASIVHSRRKTLSELIRRSRYLSLVDVCASLGISEATARRDLRFLAKEKEITRTYGGALGKFDAAFTSFVDRRVLDHNAKALIALEGREVIQENSTCFFDSGTTIFALAEALYRRPVAGLRVVTNNLPVAELLGRRPGDMEVHVLGGQFLQRQSILLGPAASQAARMWKFDLIFVGAEGFSRNGIWASQPEVAAFQKVLMQRAREIIICAHSAKLGREAGTFLSTWKSNIRLITDLSMARRKRFGLIA